MATEIINIGASPNDGTGEGLRSAFAKVNNNFSTILAAGTGYSGSIGSLGYTGSQGDTYLTTSTTSLVLGTGTQTLTVGTLLSYSLAQTIIVGYEIGRAHV